MEQGNLGCPLVSALMKMAASWSMPMPSEYWPTTPFQEASTLVETPYSGSPRMGTQ